MTDQPLPHRYAKYGLTDADAVYARAWEAHGRKVGLSPARIEEGFKWYQNFKPGMTVDEVADSFRAFTARTWNSDEVGLAATFHDAVVMNGPQHLISQDSERRSRLQELEELTKDATSDYYTGANAKELQREHFDLLEQGSSPTQGSQPQGSQPTEGQRPSRLAELNTMSANATGDYYAGDNAKGLQREHLQLLEAQVDAAPDGGTHGA